MAAPIGFKFSRILKNINSIKPCKPRCCFTTDSTGTKENERQSSDTHFGFQRVSKSEKEEKVFEVFKNVAEKYDTMNDVMSGGIHRLWKDRFINVLHPTPGTKLLDVAGGTGDIAFRFLDFIKTNYSTASLSVKDEDIEKESSTVFPMDDSTHVAVCDINPNMLKVGESRAKENSYLKGISFIEGNAESLPISDECADAYTIAFGIRNVTNVDKALEEAYRVLKPGGRFLCLEFSHVNNPVLRSIYDNYSFQAIPVFGEVIAADWKAYQYLVESIRQFPNQDEFKYMIEDAGFSLVKYENLMFGVTAIHSGFKL
ncbi:2-methoxy-6-polyprenyl-1,4-benzoquinol methylase, mitochondrial-like [Antedon mediterranea]|uniref:2-methoxy-6-polyprenyl-1,4-benzoquinol methylase, mitochondrial-like n=1 Tax=Antedon mediterranea TaxID=105859 RepID=UPI003AF8A60C